MIVLVLLFSFALQCAGNFDASEVPENIYGFQAKDINGQIVDFSEFRGKVLLIVNIASECGYTDNHYKELVELQSIFHDDSFVVLAFPCNQFGSQEPKRNSAIERFAKQTYAVQFPMFSKIKVIGEDAHPIYKWLKSINGEEPNWNFCKYLIDNQGRVVKFESPNVSPLAMFNDIEKLVLHGSIEGGTSQAEGKHTEL